MARIIPGVQVSVVKEVVPPQLAPSGVLGLVGFTEISPERITRASSWATFLGEFGSASAYVIPEVRQALENGVFELVVSPLNSNTASTSTVVVSTKDAAQKFILTARAKGVWANGYTVTISDSLPVEAGVNLFDLTVKNSGGDDVEVYKKLCTDKANNKCYALNVLNERSGIVRVEDGGLTDKAVIKVGTYSLQGGKDASPDDYDMALAALENEADVDMVLASVQDTSAGNAKNITAIYSKVIGHCERMSKDSKGRIGFGQVLPKGSVAEYADTVQNLVSDRFVLVAPNGTVGAVAGRIGSLNYFHSPTFKTLAGLGELSRVLGVTEQRTLLKNKIVPVVSQRGRGVIVLRGLTTDGDQINVRRVADRAVRGVKGIGDLFIGRLNTEDGRNALKQKLIEFLVQMEKENAIVPSTDGSSPAFAVDVYSSQADFAKGIVRVDMAVRPVRAIDFIYATILVQV